MSKKTAHPKDPLHGVTLEKIVNELVQHYGWKWLAEETNLNCFVYAPTINSSLKFLRKNPGGRTTVERLYIRYLREKSP